MNIAQELSIVRDNIAEYGMTNITQLEYDAIYQQGRADAIDEYSNELFKVIERCTVNCKLDLTVDDLHNLEVIIRGLAEEMKEQKNEKN